MTFRFWVLWRVVARAEAHVDFPLPWRPVRPRKKGEGDAFGCFCLWWEIWGRRWVRVIWIAVSMVVILIWGDWGGDGNKGVLN